MNTDDSNYTGHFGPQDSDESFTDAVDQRVRENPTQALLVAVAVGVALGVLVKVLQPRPSENRASRLLAEIQERLHELTDPAMRRMGSLASDGADFVKDGMEHVSDLHLDRTANRLKRRLRNLFS